MCEIAFATDPNVPPTWVDVSGYLQRLSIRRGRQTELDRIETGYASLALDNRDRRFDPAYTSGPYYPNVVPMRRVRLSGVWLSSKYPVFTGYIGSWPPIYNGPLDSDVELEAHDAFKVLGLKRLHTNFSEQLSGARVNDVLTVVGWGSGAAWVLGTSALGSTAILGPVGDRSIDAGASPVQYSELVEVSALQHLQDVNATENGLLFVSKDGTVVFRSRHAAVVAPYSVNQATFGEQELPYVDVEIEYSDNNLWNEVYVDREGGTTQIATDGPSIGKYFPRTLTRDNTLTTTDSEAMSAAKWLLARYKDPKLRVRSMLLDGEASPNSLWPQILGREIGDRVTVRKRPPGGGSMIEQVSTIESIELSWTAQGGWWDCRWSLSPADTTVTSYWQLNVSALGTSTVLVY